MKYCLDCGFVGTPERNTPGTLIMEIGLWIMFLVPGLIYSFWRRSAHYERCGLCGGNHIVGAESPAARAAFLKLSPTPDKGLWFCIECGEPIFNGGYCCEKCEATSSAPHPVEALVRT
jgi:hypothetical protein